jgi:D-alanyl-D-alanine carboxypeptidase/D-alanyl-D-alanine-endopeptidase (penicillin-binding protein 4)
LRTFKLDLPRLVAVLVLLDVGPGFAATADDPDIAANRLPEAMVQALRHYRIPINSVSVFAQEIGHERPIVSVASDVARNPASVIKLLPTLVALEELGPGYTWKTEAYATAGAEDGNLAGDLYLKGYGDPYFLTEHFWRLLRGLRIGGITGIDGDLVLDRSFFEPDIVDPADFDGRPYRVYNTSASALLLNFHAVNFRIEPDADVRRARIVADPQPDHVKIVNRVKLIDGPCRYWNSRPKMRVIHTPHTDTVHFSGRYAAACGQRSLFRSISEPAPYVYGVFENLWREQGGRFGGQLREGLLPAEARLLHTAYSRPLADVIRSTNKYSNNVMSRQLLLTLGAETYDPPGTLAKGVQAVHAWLQKKGLHFPELVLDNGTGLSREVRISARHLGELLLAAYRSPRMPEFVSALPIAGVDGTLHKRFSDSDFAGRLHVKTGTLDNVRAMAGYLLDAQGRRLVVVYLHNHRGAHLRAGAQVEAVFLRWLHNRP